MNDKIIDLETAKLAKEKGFNKKTNKSWRQPVVTPRGTSDKLPREYRLGKIRDKYSSFTEISYPNEDFPAPTQSLLSKWLREEYNIHITVEPTGTNYYFFNVYSMNNKKGSCVQRLYDSIMFDEMGKSFERIFELALQKGLELIEHGEQL